MLKKRILEREQFNIDCLKPIYNINPIAGSRLGTLHTEETKVLISKSVSGVNNPMYGRTGENSHLFGKSLTIETKTLMSEAKKKDNHPLYGKFHSTETKNKISITSGQIVYVYSSDNSTLINTFNSARKTAEFFDCSKDTILKYVKNGKLFKDKWILSSIKKDSN